MLKGETLFVVLFSSKIVNNIFAKNFRIKTSLVLIKINQNYLN